MQKLHFESVINAPVSKVWEMMLGDAGYREWTAAFNPKGSWFEGNWAKGSKMKFLGPEPEKGELGGMVSEIEENRPLEFLSIKHLGVLKDGEEVFSGPEVEPWAPSFENYTFEKIDDNSTKVLVDVDTDEKYVEMFNEMWVNALAKLKEICER